VTKNLPPHCVQTRTPLPLTALHLSQRVMRVSISSSTSSRRLSDGRSGRPEADPVFSRQTPPSDVAKNRRKTEKPGQPELTPFCESKKEAECSVPFSRISRSACKCELAGGSARSDQEIHTGGPSRGSRPRPRSSYLRSDPGCQDRPEIDAYRPVFEGPAGSGKGSERSASFFGLGKGVSSG
jgi:hypothetical protein